MSEMPFNADYAEMTCSECEQPILPEKAIACRCDRYGEHSHADEVFCSDDCLQEFHKID